MKPPLCVLCLRDLDAVQASTGHAGRFVAFADHRPLPDEQVGYPPGLEWFCGAHIVDASALSDQPLDEAMKTLRSPTGVSRALTGFARALRRR